MTMARLRGFPLSIWAMIVSTIGILALMTLAFAQDRPPDTMQLLRDKIRTDRKLVVATNIDLTESEARAFWPVYDGFQVEMERLASRTVRLIAEYARSYNGLSDETAKRLLEEHLAIERDRQTLRQSYLAKFRSVLPERKVARYYQIENKIRAAIDYELAAGIPLVK